MAGYAGRNWLARFFVGLVLFVNLQCAVLFLIKPELYVAGFELSGAVGMSMVRAFGLLFLMWNVPYGAAFLNPEKFRISLYEAILMQAIGFIGEVILIGSVSTDHAAIHSTIQRFIIFDGVGLTALILAAWITIQVRHQRSFSSGG
jgi:hypothetical protein